MSIRHCLLVCAGLALAGCGEKIDPGQPALDGSSCVGTTTWGGQAKAIFAQYCTSCHATGKSGADRNGAPAAVNFDVFSEAVPRAETALGHVQSGFMPPGSTKVSTADRATLKCWVQGGKKEQ